MLEIRNLTKRFGGLEALSDISMRVNEGEILGVIGPNGSGKTTLFNCISGTLPVREGRILFLGEDITSLKTFRIARRGIVRSYQVVQPFGSMTTLQNVMTGVFVTKGNYDDAERKAGEYLELVGLSGKGEERAVNLNLGERKTLEIAKALATCPKLLLLDEVMAGLTTSEVNDLSEIVRTLNRSGITIIMIEHIMEAVMSLCSRLMVLNFGKKIMEGTPAQALMDEGVAEAYFGSFDDARRS
jgi:branched-chain amino acid transport system ATP-binding protein